MLLVTDSRSLARALEKVSSPDAEIPALEVESTAAPPLITGLPPLDALLGGGFPRGKVVELGGAWSSGKSTVALRAARTVTEAGGLVAWIDPAQELYPPAAAALGVDVGRLLWIRTPPAPAAVARAGEITCRSRAFALVVIDVPAGTRLDDSTSARLRAAAHDSSAVVLVLGGAVAGASLELTVTARDDEAGRRLEIAARKGGVAEVSLGRGARFFGDELAQALGDVELGPLVRRRAPRREP